MTPKRLIYLSYPIDNALLTDDEISRINKGKAALLQHDQYPAAAVFDPGDAFQVRHGAEPGHEITVINNAALDAAEGVLAFLPRGVASIGVPMEIARAGMVGKPVAVISDSYSWALRTDGTNVQVFAEGDTEAAVEWLLSAVAPETITIEPMPVMGEGNLPTRAYSDDAGLDLYVAEDTVLPWGEFVDVPCGVQVELPPWSWGLLVARSSTFRKRQIEVLPGIIDAGYRGQLFAACIWRPDTRPEDERGEGIDSYIVRAGDRLAQLIIIPNGTKEVEPIRVKSLAGHDRGAQGFGSSGN